MNVEEKREVFQIANYFIWWADKEKIDDLTLMKLNKLIYIGYAWYYYFTGEILFSEKIEAWRYGPVIPSVYHEFKRFRKEPISSFATLIEDYDEEEVPILKFPMIEDKKVTRILYAAFDFYKNQSGAELSKITHEENGAWDYIYNQGRGSAKNGFKFDMTDEELQEKIKKRAIEGITKLVKTIT